MASLALVESGFTKPTIVIPTFNERENILQLLGEIFQMPNGFHVIIVDDHSPDGTGQVVDDLARSQPRLHVIHRTGKQGLGTAYVEGFRLALSLGADLIFEMDADFSHDPKALVKIMDVMPECDLAIGSRYLMGISVVNWPLRRLAISLIASLYVREILDMPVKDATSGFVCYRRTVLETINLNHVRSNGYAFQIEMKYKAFLHGLRLREVPIIFVDRALGLSKISRRIVWEAIWIVWRLRWDGFFWKRRHTR